MAAHAVLVDWTDEAIDKIQAHAESIGGDHPEVVEAVERIQDPIGWDGVRAPDAEHEQVFRLQAIADLLEAVDNLKGGEVAEPLQQKTVPELREMANEKGVEGSVSQMNKTELIGAIKEKENA